MTPRERAERDAQLDTQLEELAGPEATVEPEHPVLRAAKAQAAVFLTDPRYEDLRTVLQGVAGGNLEPQPLLGPAVNATLSEYAIFRAGARAQHAIVEHLALAYRQEQEEP